ncbi:alpha/beta fold hydrolase [Streptomyces benahoarensis]|uniref:Alpha/beta hydrolase n=1 Tax=Streptomyces benahoarensis TaxID=2595054 RepID=A0A553YVP8_9ACTN|nr:alpha/beta fold hydrolase [Streptomyces benahoarensis]TSB17640.1 alpha/beta hydrolase [Streptomyces benahoarensis]TSB33274.1 alpha/beta hydrolase [Streptomyces benahoarensis]
MQTLPTFVLVHGAFANSFSFAPLQAELGLLGHRSVAVDLPGHGFEATFPAAYQAPQDLDALATEPGGIKDVTLADAVARVIAVLERAQRNGPTVLVGHSRGGITLTAVGNARPDLVDRLVYVSAWCPVDLDVAGYYAEPEMADVDPAALATALVGNPAELGLLRTNFRTADPTALASLRQTVGADLTDDEFRTFLNTFQPDDNLDAGTIADCAQEATWGRIPKTYVRLAEDLAIPLDMQDRMIREGDALTPGNPFDVHTLQGSHLRWLVHPEPAAELLGSLVTG